MKKKNTQIQTLRAMIVGSLVAAGTLAAVPVSAGGLLLYEIGTEDVGLASAGYTARAQDASTVFTNPAGMTRLDGSQLTAGRCRRSTATWGSRSARALRPDWAAGTAAIRSAGSRVAAAFVLVRRHRPT